MNTLENLEMVLFDFDDTLCIHSHRSDSYEELMEYLSYIHSGETFPKSWNKSKPNLQLKKFMDYLAYKNIPMGLISGVRDCKTAERKIKWVKENYGYLLENYCVSSREQKIIELGWPLQRLTGFMKTRLLLSTIYIPILKKQKVKVSLLFPQCRLSIYLMKYLNRDLLILPRLHKITIFHCRICER